MIITAIRKLIITTPMYLAGRTRLLERIYGFRLTIREDRLPVWWSWSKYNCRYHIGHHIDGQHCKR